MSRQPPDDRILGKLRWPLRDAVFGKDPGGWRSRSGGDGIELATVREYVSGDDVRRINWTAAARTGQLQVTVPVAERALNTRIVLDTSGSMAFGSMRSKFSVAVEAVETLSRIASRHADRVQLYLADPQARCSGAHQGRSANLAVTALLHDATAQGQGSFAASLAAAPAGHNGLLIAVGDFRDQETRDALVQVCRRVPVLVVVLHDPHERALPDVGGLTLRDPETGRTLTVDTSDRELRGSFAAHADELRIAVLDAARGAIAVIDICTDGPHGGVQVVQSLLAGRRARR